MTTTQIPKEITSEKIKFDKQFKSDDEKVLQMIIHNVYSDSGAFLRELISNASDALSKLKEQWLELNQDDNADDIADISDFAIKIIPLKEEGILLIEDNGIGMTKEDLNNFLGTICNSGTQKLKNEAESKGDKNLDNMIGQYGIGFYSSYIPANMVTVVSKSAKDKAYSWTSDGVHGFTIQDYELSDEEKTNFKHGTKIFLHLRKGMEEYLDTHKLEDLVRKYSMCIEYPIQLLCSKEVEVEDEEKKEDENKEGEEEKKEKENKEVEEISDEDSKPLKKKKVVEEFRLVNLKEQIWNKKLSEINPKDLQEYYRGETGDFDDYVEVKEFEYQGTVNVKVKIFLPSRNRVSLFSDPNAKVDNVKVYSSNVTILESLPRDVIKPWMDFLWFIISSPNVTLNIDRSSLQDDAMLNILRTKLPGSIFNFLNDIKETDAEKFAKVYSEYERSIKMAVSSTNGQLQQDFATLLKYPTTDSEKPITLMEHLNNCPESTKDIYYLTSISENSKNDYYYLKGFPDLNIVLMYNPGDEFMLQNFKSFRGCNFVNVSIDGPVVEKYLKAEDDKIDASMKRFAEHVKEILKDKVESVVVSDKPTNITGLVFAGKNGLSSTVEHLLRNQGDSKNNIMLRTALMKKKTLVLFSQHPLIQDLQILSEKSEHKDEFNALVRSVYSTLSNACGFVSEEGEEKKYYENVLNAFSTQVSNLTK